MFPKVLLLYIFLLLTTLIHSAEPFTFVEYNCENFFDVTHDSLKNDYEFLPDGERLWNRFRMHRKANDIGRAILQCGGKGEQWSLPDMVGLIEVENDSVMQYLTRRSVLREAGYKYVITNSDDPRGIDVALLYNPFTIKLLKTEFIPIPNTRSILYAMVQQRDGDTLHVYVVHAPSRRGGRDSDIKRIKVIQTLIKHMEELKASSSTSSASTSSTSALPLDEVTERGVNILVAGDFNDYSHGRSIKKLVKGGLIDVTEETVGLYHPEEVLGTYSFRREWNSLDHILVSGALLKGRSCHSFILDEDWLLDFSVKGDYRPRRSYLGPIYHGGVSDHLPLVISIK